MEHIIKEENKPYSEISQYEHLFDFASKAEKACDILSWL